jgi:hypothetical protein
MLWFDNDAQRPLTEKVERAAKHYQSKYGATPNLCYANPQAFGEGQGEVVVNVSAVKTGKAPEAITLKQARTILPNHFWLGVSEN